MTSDLDRKRVALVGLFALVGVGICLRGLGLGDAVLHHDESIHAVLSYNWFRDPEHAFYQYSPVYHGPFLYLCTRWLYWLFGVGVAQARLIPFLFGTAAIFSPFLFVPFLSLTEAALACGLIAISPLMIYYSRFLGHDMPVVCFTAAVAAFFLHYRRARAAGHLAVARRYLLGAAAALGLLFSAKLNGLVHVFLFVSFAGFRRLVGKRSGEARQPDVGGGTWFLAVTLFLAVYAVIQTSFFHHAQGFLDGLYRESIPYWWDQHKHERLGGPAFFHLRSLLLHELPLLVLAVGYALFPLGRGKLGKGVGAALLLGILAALVWPSMSARWPYGLVAEIMDATKIRGVPDLFVYLLAFCAGILGSCALLWRGKELPAFFVYWGFSVFALYSFVGEKVPWLTVHVVFPFALLGGLALGAAMRRWQLAIASLASRRARIALGLACLLVGFQLRLAYLVSDVTAGEGRDVLSQVHEQKDVRFVESWFLRVAMEGGETPDRMGIALYGETGWAFNFYLIENNFRHFSFDSFDKKEPPRFVLTSENRFAEVDKLLKPYPYRRVKLNLMGWYVPEHHALTWSDWFQYALFRRTPDPATYTPLYVYYRPLEGAE